MRILHICRRFRNVGGMERYLYDLCGLLAAAGHESHVLYDEESPENFRIPSVSTTCVPGVASFLPSRAERAWAELEDVIAAFAPDLVHVHDPSNPHNVLRCQERLPTLASVQTAGHYCLGTKFFPRDMRPCDRPFGPGCLTRAVACGCATRRPMRLAREYPRVRRELAALRRCRSLAVCSQYMRSVLATNGVDPSRVTVVPSFSPGVPEPEPLPDAPRLLFAGRITKGKGLELLIEALARVPGAELDVVGDGDRLPACRALAGRLGVEPRARFLGWRSGPELMRSYARCRVVVFPSVWPEPFGLVGIEAYAHGRPVVGVRVGGIPEWLEDGRTGFLCEPSPESLAEAIARLLDDPERAVEMGAAARRLWEARFSPPVHLRLIEQAYDWCLRKGFKKAPVGPKIVGQGQK